jgi:hypothetical protein
VGAVAVRQDDRPVAIERGARQVEK